MVGNKFTHLAKGSSASGSELVLLAETQVVSIHYATRKTHSWTSDEVFLQPKENKKRWQLIKVLKKRRKSLQYNQGYLFECEKSSWSLLGVISLLPVWLWETKRRWFFYDGMLTIAETFRVHKKLTIWASWLIDVLCLIHPFLWVLQLRVLLFEPTLDAMLTVGVHWVLLKSMSNQLTFISVTMA